MTNLRVSDLVDASYLNDAEDVEFQTNGARNEMLRPKLGGSIFYGINRALCSYRCDVTVQP